MCLQLDYADVLQCRSMGLRTASFESNAFVGHRFDQDIPIAEHTSDIDSIR